MNFQSFLDSLRGKRIAVLGMGISNEPLVRLLAKENMDVTVRDKGSKAGIPGVKYLCGPDYLEDITEDVVFRTPGIRPDLVKLPEQSVLTSEMAAFFEVCPCPIIAVTGSDGKTTTTTLIAKMLEAAGKRVWLGGNIGHPLLTEAEAISPEDYAVVELSSFQLMDLQRSPHVAVVTNVRPNHLDWHRGLEEYAEAKANILRHQKPGDVLVLNGDDEGSAPYAGLCAGSLRCFSREKAQQEGCSYDGKQIYLNGEAFLSREEIRLPGDHNVENYMAAICAVWPLVSRDAILSVAREFGGVSHRLELVRELEGVSYYNDSIASSPTRTMASLRVFPEKSVVLIAGGYDKQIPYGVMGAEVNRYVRTLVLTGPTGEKIRQAVLEAPGEKPEILAESEFEAAVEAAAKAAKPGDRVLLSPASASFDRFRNFEERGNYFRELVNRM